MPNILKVVFRSYPHFEFLKNGPNAHLQFCSLLLNVHKTDLLLLTLFVCGKVKRWNSRDIFSSKYLVESKKEHIFFICTRSKGRRIYMSLLICSSMLESNCYHFTQAKNKRIAFFSRPFFKFSTRSSNHNVVIESFYMASQPTPRAIDMGYFY